MKPITEWGIRGQRWSIIGWTWGISIYIAINVLVYSSIRDQAQTLNKVLTSLPPAAQALFGAQGGNFLSPVGYLSSKLYYLILPLLFTMLAVSLSTKLLGREEQDGTLELLLARPVSRGKVLLAKLLSAFTISLAVAMLTLVVTIICAWAIDYDISTLRLAQAAAMTLLLSLVFGSIAWLALCIGRLGRHASAGAAGFVALGSYLFSSLEGFAHWLEWPAKLLPFHYYDPTAILQGSYNWWNAAGMAATMVIILLLAYASFKKRDLA